MSDTMQRPRLADAELQLPTLHLEEGISHAQVRGPEASPMRRSSAYSSSAGAHLQFLPSTSWRANSVSSRNPSEANTMGQSGRLGSAMTKFCWMRSTVVARSSATRGKALGAVIFFPRRAACLACSSSTTFCSRGALTLCLICLVSA